MTQVVYETVRVDATTRSYDVVVGAGILDSVGERVRAACKAHTAFVVTDDVVSSCADYLERTLGSLSAAGLETAFVCVPHGEEHKQLSTYGRILTAMAEAGLTRDDVVVALGGGVVGDMAGFAAATYMRGIEVVQVPTTLLSMVDSSVGGKTAIDLHEGKNLVGAFLQPSLVLADVQTLATLAPEVYTDGWGEIVKHAVLADADLFERLCERPVENGSDQDLIGSIVARNVQIKRDVVNQDEKERGLRQTLNLGHTIGHAIEAASDYRLLHGHCVAAGLCCVARATEAMGWTEPGLAGRIERCCATQGLPTNTDFPHEQLLAQAGFDKKRHGDTVNLVVPASLAHAEIRTVTLEQLADLIRLGCGA